MRGKSLNTHTLQPWRKIKHGGGRREVRADNQMWGKEWSSYGSSFRNSLSFIFMERHFAGLFFFLFIFLYITSVSVCLKKNFKMRARSINLQYLEYYRHSYRKMWRRIRTRCYESFREWSDRGTAVASGRTRSSYWVLKTFLVTVPSFEVQRGLGFVRMFWIYTENQAIWDTLHS